MIDRFSRTELIFGKDATEVIFTDNEGWKEEHRIER